MARAEVNPILLRILLRLLKASDRITEKATCIRVAFASDWSDAGFFGSIDATLKAASSWSRLHGRRGATPLVNPARHFNAPLCSSPSSVKNAQRKDAPSRNPIIGENRGEKP